MSGSVLTPFFCSGESPSAGPALLQADVKKPRFLGASPDLRASLPDGAPAPFSCRAQKYNKVHVLKAHEAQVLADTHVKA